MKKISVFILTVFFLLISCSVLYAKEDSIKLIQKAYRDGELDYQTALNYKLYAIFSRNRNKLPRAYQSDDVPVKSATSVILEARENPHLLFSDNRFILYRPTDSGDSDYYGSGIAVLTYDSPGGNFKIHYTEDNTNSDAVYGFDGNPATVPQYVIDLASYLDNSWTQVITSMGYVAPPSDGVAGGDSRLDVYLVNMNAYGYTAYEGGGVTYIVIENDFTGFPSNLDPDGSQKGAMKVTVVHEFFHTSQLQYTINTSNLWWMEATSTWMEDVIYSSVKDYLNYLGRKYDDANDNGTWDTGEAYYMIDGVTPLGTTGRSSGWFDHPEYSLDSTSGTHEYGDIIWAKYLSERYGTGIINSVWVRIGSGSDALTAVSDEISSRGSVLSSAFGSFQVANYKLDYVDGFYYPLIRHEAAYSSYPRNISGLLNHLSSNFYAFKADSTTSTLTLTFTSMNSGNLAVKLILKKVAGGYDERDIVLDNAAVTSQITDFGTSSTYSKVVVVVMNIAFSQDLQIYSISANKEASSGGGGGGGGGGCFIATAAYGSYLAPEVEILRQFRDEYLITNPAGHLFVKFYYKVSPPVAAYISGNKNLKALTRFALAPIVYGLKYPYMPVGFIGFIIMLILYRKQRKSKFKIENLE